MRNIKLTNTQTDLIVKLHNYIWDRCGGTSEAYKRINLILTDGLYSEDDRITLNTWRAAYLKSLKNEVN